MEVKTLLNLFKKNNKDMSNKKVALNILKENKKIQAKIEKSIDIINSNVNIALRNSEIIDLDNKLQKEKQEYEETKKVLDKIFKMHNDSSIKKEESKINEHNNSLDKKIFIVEKKIENKKNEFGLKEKKEEEYINLQKEIEDSINILSSKINDAKLYSLYNYEYEIIELKQKSEAIKNNAINASLEELRIKLENKIILKQKQQLGYHVEEKNEIGKTDGISTLDINKVKDILDSDVKAKEKQLKSLLEGKVVSSKNSFHLINRLTNTILNITLGLVSFNWFKNKIVSKLVSSIFIYNGIIEMSNIIDKKHDSYIDFKSIEAYLSDITSVSDKNIEIIIDSLNEINKLKSNLLNNYYSIKHTKEFKEVFESINKIQNSLYESNKKVLKNKDMIKIQ